MSDRLCNHCVWQELQEKDPTLKLQADPLLPAFPKAQRVVKADGTDYGHWFAEVTTTCVC